jgi:hypothetical protein
MIKGLRRRGVRMLLTATAMLAGAAGVALATIPGTDSVINGCYEKRTGILRVLDTEAGKKCLSFESPISWNQQGPKGTPGPQGAQGPQGLSGAAGEDGADGEDGASGANGISVTSATEPAGANCAFGGVQFTAANGQSFACNGAPGQGGAQGAPGPTGPPGPPGLAQIRDVEWTTQQFLQIDTDTTKRAVAMCPVGKELLGGGFRPPWTDVRGNFAIDAELIESTPFFIDGATPAPGWAVTFRERTPTPHDWLPRVWAVCATIAGD